MPDIDSVVLKDLLSAGCIYAMMIFGFNLLIPNLSRGSKIEKIKQEINSIKANEEVFTTLLTQQPQYEVSESDSQIHFGNPDAQLKITILTNPFCNPCAKMHKRVEKLLKDTKGNV
jgi:protein-disulfide isomerase